MEIKQCNRDETKMDDRKCKWIIQTYNNQDFDNIKLEQNIELNKWKMETIPT